MRKIDPSNKRQVNVRRHTGHIAYTHQYSIRLKGKTHLFSSLSIGV